MEVANSNLILNAASFLNTNGNLLHAGAGTFDISTANLTQAGGNLVTRGGLTVTADNWTNSSVIQAGRLTVNVGTFNQTASGQLLASSAFVGTGGTWTNEGVIASDGTLSLNLSGGYAGNGRTSSAGIMGINAAQIDLNAATAITAGTGGTITSSGSISNLGRLTSIGDLTVNAASVNNQGTLGAGGNLRTNSDSLSNQNGLIFSGGNMALRTNTFTNRFADVYSLGDLSIAKDDSGGWSSSINNISATMESVGDISLAADYIENRKDVFEVTGGLVSGAIGVRCYACDAPGRNPQDSHMVWIEKYSSTVVRDSASSMIVAGRNFTGSGREFVNSASTLSAGNDLALKLERFTNQGAVTGDYTVRRSFNSGEVGVLSFWDAVMAYNAANDPLYASGPYASLGGSFATAIHFWNANNAESLVGAGFQGAGGDKNRRFTFGTIWLEAHVGSYSFASHSYSSGIRINAPASVANASFFENTITYTSPASSANAVVQAGGAVRINASQELTNSVVREGVTLGVGTSKMGLTQLSGQAKPTVVQINAQLSPDLSQQQVNPLTLPGFSLPTGQNGLFRLSAQTSSNVAATQTSTAPQNWTLGSASVSVAQREQTVSDAQARALQFGTAGQVSSATRQLADVVRQNSGLSANASAFDSSAPVDSATRLQLTGHSAGSTGLTQVADVTQVQGQNGTVPLPGQGATIVPVITPVTSNNTTAQNGPTTPTAVPNNQVARVQALPGTAAPSNPHKYLIETNPVLTELRQFMSSDYLLANLGYDPEASARRLGDGFYEQRLVQQAVVARTGQAFLAGQTSNEAQLKYLMDNAIASKEQLNLAIGVTLSPPQVAALTHDIVWLEEHEVNGEKVLVPVLYLAQANNRLGPTGALIAGNDVTLTAGGNLDNVGTLRATNNLSATAGNDLVNTGLIEAGNRLDLLAGNDLINKAGGILYGRDVTLTATRGDVINERTVISTGSTALGRDFADSAARIESANDLTVAAGRDVQNIGGTLQAGRDLRLIAGRDVNINSVETEKVQAWGANSQSSITQIASNASAGRDLTAQSGRDINIIASNIDAKRDITMSATENMTISSAADESHSLFRSKKLTVQNDHVKQVSANLNAGGSIALSAGQDLEVTASRVSAGNEAYVYAGNDLSLNAAENSDYSFYSKTKKGSWGKKKSTMTESESVVAVGSVIEAANKVILSAVQDINTEGAKVSSGGVLGASAGRDINLDVAENFSSQASASSKKGIFSSRSSVSASSQSTVISTELRGKSLDLAADNDIRLSAAALYADESAKLVAGRDIEIGTAQQSQSSSSASSSSKFAFTWLGETSLQQKAQKNQQGSTEALGSSISAETLDIKSGRDTAVSGSTLVTDGDTRIEAGRNLEIASAENAYSSSGSSSSKKTGEIGRSWQSSLGVVKLKESNDSDITRQMGSQVASLEGNVSLSAGEHYGQVASQVVTPQGEISIKAKQVDIVAGFDSLSSNHATSANKTAVGGSVSIPLLDAARGLQQAVNSGSETSDPRMQGLAALNAAMSAKKGYDAAQQLMSNAYGFKVSLSLGNSQSQSDSNQSGRNVVASSLAAGGDVNVQATGAGQDSTLNVVGSSIDAGRDVNLKADGDINLLAAQNTATQNSTNSNSGWSVGIGFTVGGQQNGFTLDLAANKGQGKSDGDDVTQSNTRIKAGNVATLESGGDTSLKGAEVIADQVKATVGGDLNIESLQDTSEYSSKQVSASVGISLCIPPFCAGTSGSASFNQQKMQSEYASVSQQSGIKAGDGGFQVDVQGNTGLVGAVIASSDQAVIDGKNTLSTGTLTSSDIKNKAEYDASSIGLSASVGIAGRDGDGKQKAGAPGQPVATTGENKASANAPIILLASGESKSITQSGISGAAITIKDEVKQQALTGQTAEQTIAAINTDVSSDRDGSNKLKPIFDANEIQTNFNIVGTFVQNVGVFLEDRAREVDNKKISAEKALADSRDPTRSAEERQASRDAYLTLRQEAKDIANDWGAGGTYRQIATALVAGISGNVTGASSQFAQNMVINYVQQQGSAAIGDLVVKGLKEGSPEHAALHAILGCAGAAASNQRCSVGAMGGAASSVLTRLFSEARPDETDAEREAKRNIITSLVAGIAFVSDPSSASAATNAATANVDNNWLATQQLVQAKKEISEARSMAERIQLTGKWFYISARQDVLTGSGFAKGFTDGMAGIGLDTLNSTAGFMRDPVESWNSVSEFVSSTEAIKLLGATAHAALQSQVEQINKALQEGGDANAENLGNQMGQALAVVIGMVAGGGGAGAAGAQALMLSKMGIEVSSQALRQAQAGFKVGVDKIIAKLEKTGVDPDVPLVNGAKGGSSETVTYFRVEGGGSGTKTSQNRITANEDGTITINPGCTGQICVSVGNADHATYYLTNKRPDGSVVVFDIDAGLHKEIMSKVVPQRPVAGMTKDPDAPKRVDKDQPGYSLELPKVWESLLEKSSSNARVYTQDEFLKEFKK
ncbi:hemagglutinin repeat-containing protein [Pseudomonas cichorii]|uniref:hemagglutinin repeat-containing protein n=1 Tax=Pseudomonas cichorii TaxID=36746 RepID=UPI001F43D5A0|nr:hemagglutinin repeat-containing protein [Pseudomonas cichorii]